MRNTAPIGAFDSGVGGLSIIGEVRRLLPNEDLIYLADSAHCPYGEKTVEAIRQRILDVSSYLIELGAKMIVVACNTACVAGLDQIRETYPVIPVVGVEPAVKPAYERTRNGKIGVLATAVTLEGARFSTLVERYGSDIEVYNRPIHGLVELVEQGEITGAQLEKLLHEYLDPLLEIGVDTLVLGCTHYPFVRPAIQKICGPEVLVLDTGEAVAKQTVRVLEQQGIKNPKTSAGTDVFYTSGDPEEVSKVVRLLWKSPNAIDVKKSGV